jgi:transcription initiation factor TFIIIB Brf1 subunit/transcription initiation factor TFIIB
LHDKKDRSETQRLVKAIVVLIRNTTWRCGKLERLIVRNLHKRNVSFGKPEMSIKDMLQNFNLTGKKKNEFLDALKRLERRNIVRILTIVN